MPDKELERFYLSQLGAALSLDLVGASRDSETPDFLVECAGRLLGVEFTQFHRSAPPGGKSGKELSSLQSLTVDVARRKFRAQGGGAFYVDVVFSGRGPTTKARAHELGCHLADGLAASSLPRSITEGDRRVPLEPRQPEIASVQVLASIDGEDDLWQGGTGGLVQPVSRADVSRMVEAKNAKLSVVRSKCQTAWLVLAHDLFREGDCVRLTETAASVPYETGYDRIIWLEVHVPSVTDLKVAAV